MFEGEIRSINQKKKERNTAVLMNTSLPKSTSRENVQVCVVFTNLDHYDHSYNGDIVVVDLPGRGCSCPLFPGQNGIWDVGRKTKGPGEKPRNKDESQQKTQPTCYARCGN